MAESYKQTPARHDDDFISRFLITNEDGTQSELIVREEDLKGLNKNSKVLEALDDHMEIEHAGDEKADGLSKITVSFPEFYAGSSIPLGTMGAKIREGTYYVLYGEIRTKDSGGDINPEHRLPENGLLLVEDKELVEPGDECVLSPVTVTVFDDDTGKPVDGTQLYLWSINRTDKGEEEEAGFLDLVGSLLVAIASDLFIHDKIDAGDALDRAIELAKQDTNAIREQHEANTKLANVITDLPIDGLNHGIDVSGFSEKKRGKQVLTAVSLNYEDEDVRLTRHLTFYDREVSNAVTAHYIAGNRVITARQVWQTMTGREGAPGKTTLQKVDESVQRLMHTWAEIDYTQEARGRSLEVDGEAVKDCRVSGHLLEGKRVRIETAKGSTVYGYEFNGTPILYQHAVALGQVVTYPQRLLSTADAGSDTEQNTVIKHYLLRRIGQMKHSPKVPRKILYKTVYENCGIENPTRKKQKSVNDYVIAVLGIWKRDGYIKGFRECTEGRGAKRTGVELKI